MIPERSINKRKVSRQAKRKVNVEVKSIRNLRGILLYNIIPRKLRRILLSTTTPYSKPYRLVQRTFIVVFVGFNNLIIILLC